MIHVGADLRWLPLLLLAGCAQPEPAVLGTLEVDTITVPSPAMERIVAIDVTEGQSVEAGQVIVRLEASRGRARLDELTAAAQAERERSVELAAGTRREQLAAVRAELAGADAALVERRLAHERALALAERQLIPRQDLDRTAAVLAAAVATRDATRARLAELEAGARAEERRRTAAVVDAAEARVRGQALDVAELLVRAPRAGRVDSLPFHVGDQPAVGAPLAILQVETVPHARVYVPAPLRDRFRVGAALRATIGDDETQVPARVRMIRSEPTFTPYYALSGDDATRLSFVAELDLDAGAARLAPGLPVRILVPEAGDGQ